MNTLKEEVITILSRTFVCLHQCGNSSILFSTVRDKNKFPEQNQIVQSNYTNCCAVTVAQKDVDCQLVFPGKLRGDQMFSNTLSVLNIFKGGFFPATAASHVISGLVKFYWRNEF